MTAKEYLSQYRDADREIQAKVDQIARLRDLATHITSMSTGDRVQSSPENKIERICAKIADMETEVDEEIDKLQETKTSVERAISSVPDAKQRTVLERRYINGERWPRICTAIYGNRVDFQDCYDSYLRTLYRIHGRALLSVRSVIECHY